MSISKGNRGGALLAVLWLSAALSAIAFAIANTVRGETERTSTEVDGLKSYYLATGAIERAVLYMQWRGRYYTPGTPLLSLSFPTGDAQVEIIPEASKFNINAATPEDLYRLLLNLGVEAERAREIVLAILDWRTPAPDGLSPFDQFYLSLNPSFRARHASFEEIEELLLVKGMTPDIFYGTYDRDAQGRMMPHAGLKDCVSVFGAIDRFDINTAQPAVLRAAGLSTETINAIVQTRRIMPFGNFAQVAAFGPAAAQRLRIGGNSIYTLRATARLRLETGGYSDLRRSVSAMVKFMPAGYDASVQILRWHNNAWSN